jgi:FkbM family methyltransferase
MLKQHLRHLAYQAIDLATARRGIPRCVNGEGLRLPPEVSRYYPAVYEPETHAFITRHTAPGTVAIDAGAHIGLFTVTMARVVGPQGRVLSFEPTETNARALERTVALNGLDGVVDCRQEALAATRGFAEFYVDEHESSNANSLVRRAGTTGAVRVPTVAIDDVAGEHGAPVSCMKIDVEGTELDVLRGAERTLARDAPALALDVHPAQLGAAGGTVAELWDLLDRHGYELGLGGAAIDRADAVGRTEIFEVHAVSLEGAASG